MKDLFQTVSEWIHWLFFTYIVSLLGGLLSLSFYQVPFQTGLSIFLVISIDMLPYAVLYIVLWIILLLIGRNNLDQLFKARFKGISPKLSLRVSIGRGIQPMEVSGSLDSIGKFLEIKRDNDGYVQQIPWRSIVSLSVLPKRR